MWVLGVKPRSKQRQPVLLTAKMYLQPHQPFLPALRVYHIRGVLGSLSITAGMFLDVRKTQLAGLNACCLVLGQRGLREEDQLELKIRAIYMASHRGCWKINYFRRSYGNGTEVVWHCFHVTSIQSPGGISERNGQGPKEWPRAYGYSILNNSQFGLSLPCGGFAGTWPFSV